MFKKRLKKKNYLVHEMVITNYGSMINTETTIHSVSNLETAIVILNDCAEIFERWAGYTVRLCDDPIFKVIIGRDLTDSSSFDIHECRLFIKEELVY